MYLSSLEISNFRGIRSARLDFTDTTIIIGENDSGKTTLLDAISSLLAYDNPEAPVTFQFEDFHDPGPGQALAHGGQIRISLIFRERSRDEWSSMQLNELGLALPDDPERLQELRVEVMATKPLAGKPAKGQYRIWAEGRPIPPYSFDMQALSWIRRLNPVYRIKGGNMNNLPEESEAIHQLYQSELRALAGLSHLFSQEGPPLEDILYEILGRSPDLNRSKGRQVRLRRGSAAEKLGMLIFASALLQSGGLNADASAEPIVILEDPEAHLHPMTLQAVKILVQRLKWQKIITTQSGDLIAEFPLSGIRRISRREGFLKQYAVQPGALSSQELRRLSYHVRMRQSTAIFARCWLLVEGETEIWLLPHLARLCGYDLSMEGIICVEFAQCGISPLIKSAEQLGIQWFLLSDGDPAGKAYAETARHFALQRKHTPDAHFLRLKERDIEHHLYFNGYASVYQEYAEVNAGSAPFIHARTVIGKAIHRNSKPFMAVAVVEAISREGSPGVPPELRTVIEKAVSLAKGAV